MKYSDIVVNCIGREYETRNFKFKDVNVTGPATLARIAKEMGVKRFIHISSINASDNPQVCIFFPLYVKSKLNICGNEHRFRKIKRSEKDNEIRRKSTFSMTYC